MNVPLPALTKLILQVPVFLVAVTEYFVADDESLQLPEAVAFTAKPTGMTLPKLNLAPALTVLGIFKPDTFCTRKSTGIWVEVGAGVVVGEGLGLGLTKMVTTVLMLQSAAEVEPTVAVVN